MLSIRSHLFVAILAGWSSLACTRRPVATDEPHGLQGLDTSRQTDQPIPDGVDLLLVVDDSLSMKDKQMMLRQSFEALSGVALYCLPPLEEDGRPPSHTLIPAIKGRCPDEYRVTGLLPAVRSFAVITTSMEAAGNCLPQSRQAHPVHASWDGGKTPLDYVADVSDVGEGGCGFEAPLEAMYRFLIDPQPPKSVRIDASGPEPITVAEGIDEVVLAAREKFLGPLTNVLVLILTDEDDCSVVDHTNGWQMGNEKRLLRGTTACATEPGSACCRSCGAEETTPPEDCVALAEDDACAKGEHSVEEDPLNLRCFDQKRRFGLDFLQPVSRYVDGLTSPRIRSREGTMVDNPLFASGRTKDMVSVLVLTGTPWQLISDKASLSNDDLVLLTPEEYRSEGRWDRIVGDPTTLVPPSDAHMISSPLPRPGLPFPDEEWDPIHGHEVVRATPDELQYSCIFDLPEPRDCSDDLDCACHEEEALPLCRAPDGSFDVVQRRGQAYPAPRLLEFVRALGDQGLNGSICPKSTIASVDGSTSGSAYGYTAALSLLAQGSYGNQLFGLNCFNHELPLLSNGKPNCHLLEAYVGSHECAALSRQEAEPTSALEFVRSLGEAPNEGLTICEIPPFAGGVNDEDSEYFACANQVHPTLTGPGFCYIDSQLGQGNRDLVSMCQASNPRRIRAIPQVYPFAHAARMMMCDYGSP